MMYVEGYRGDPNNPNEAGFLKADREGADIFQKYRELDELDRRLWEIGR
jgi:hypothetical protein